MIEFNKHPGQRVLELGGGNARQPVADCMVDVRPGPGVDFPADFNQPLPLKDAEWDAVISIFCLEHVSYRSVRLFLGEIHRVCKPGGKAVIVTANTEAQVEWAKANANGWDGRDDFDSFSGILFGDQDYPENSHRSYFSPNILMRLFNEAGFSPITLTPFGARSTDIMIEAVRPVLKAWSEGQLMMSGLAWPQELISKMGEKCLAIGPGGAVCRLAKGHQGNHQAEVA